jgi:hypothetical protein
VKSHLGEAVYFEGIISFKFPRRIFLPFEDLRAVGLYDRTIFMEKIIGEFVWMTSGVL